MSNFREMPLDTELQVGDVVTISGPGEHDVLVREVTGLRTSGAAKIHGMFYADIPFSEALTSGDRTMTRVQRPVPALPTTEGDYIVERPNGYRQAASLRGGVWLDPWGAVSAEWLADRVEDGSNFTRVLPADEVKHPEVDIQAAGEAFRATYAQSEDTYANVFKVFLRRVLGGEFDL